MIRRRWIALGGAAVVTLRLVGVALTFAATVVALALLLVVVGVVLVPLCIRGLRAQAAGLAATHARFTGVAPRVPELAAEGAGDGLVAHARSTRSLLADPAAWLLLRWAALETLVGIVIAAAPLALIAWGLRGLVVLPAQHLLSGEPPSEWIAVVLVRSPELLPLAALLGAGLVVVGVLTAPWWLRLHARWAALLLGPGRTELRERVDALADSRASTREDAAAQLRRLEREVHDGTQSQLVAIGLTLGTAEALLEEDPDRARRLIAQARDDSSAALAELRDLMRGIRPPILADRGLGAALEALALDAVTTVTADVDLPDGLDPALESAVYFATRELVTNALKHASASRVALHARLADGRLIVTVADDGFGGAVPVPGRGLDGVGRRLAAFDGTLALVSPAGGPTTARIEVPCAS